MKKIILRFFTFIALLYLVDQIINGFELYSTAAALILAALLSISQFTIKPAIKFLTLPFNMLTYGIFNFVISCVLLYLYNFIVPGLRLTAGSIGPIFTSDIQLSEVKLSQIGVIILASFIMALLNNVVSWTQGEGGD